MELISSVIHLLNDNVSSDRFNDREKRTINSASIMLYHCFCVELEKILKELNHYAGVSV